MLATRRALLVLALMACVGVLLVVPPGLASSYSVDDLGDEPDLIPGDGACETAGATCTLRAAIEESNASPGLDLILVGPGRIEAQSTLFITDGLELSGVSASASSISGAGASRELIEIQGVFDVRIRNLSFVEGQEAGIVVVDSTLSVDDCAFLSCSESALVLAENTQSPHVTVRDCEFRDNQGAFAGAAIRGAGELSVHDSCFIDNMATEAGGALADVEGFNSGGLTVQIADCIFEGNVSGNRGGALHFGYESTVTIERSRIDLNEAVSGGAIATYVSGSPPVITVRDSTISGNRAYVAAGIAIDGETLMRLERCTLSSNVAEAEGGAVGIGAIAAPATSERVLLLSSTTVTNNEAQVGSAVWSLGGSVDLENSTVSGNQALNTDGATLHAEFGAAIRLASSTVAANQAVDGAAGLAGDGSFVLRNTIVAGNLGGGMPKDCSSALDSLGFNFVQEFGDCSWRVPGVGDIIRTDPELTSLSDQGGPTLVHAPLLMSPVIDMGDPGGCLDTEDQPLLLDQVGRERHLDGFGFGPPFRCDIGAVEGCGPDMDLDGVGSSCDCAPDDEGAFAAPGLVSRLELREDAGGVLLSWDDLAPSSGEGVAYQVASAPLTALWGGRTVDAECLDPFVFGPGYRDDRPASPDGDYYLVRAANVCSDPVGRWGQDSAGGERMPACF